MTLNPDPNDCLRPTHSNDSTDPAIRAVVSALGIRRFDQAPGAAELFRYVRDEVQYEFKGKFDPEPYVASNILSGGKGFFVQKALLLCALGRAAGIPSALVLCDVRDQSLSPKTVEAMGLNILNRH